MLPSFLNTEEEKSLDREKLFGKRDLIRGQKDWLQLEILRKNYLFRIQLIYRDNQWNQFLAPDSQKLGSG
jgi:hypothetical protein